MPIYIDLPEDELVLTAETIALEDGATGYYQRNFNDCLRAAVATATQIPYDEVLDTEPRDGNGGQGAVVRGHQELCEWAADRGLRVEVLVDPPIDNEQRWVGITPRGEDGYRHTIVIRYGGIYFDPASGFETPDGTEIATTREIEYGIAFHPREVSVCPS